MSLSLSLSSAMRPLVNEFVIGAPAPANLTLLKQQKYRFLHGDVSISFKQAWGVLMFGPYVVSVFHQGIGFSHKRLHSNAQTEFTGNWIAAQPLVDGYDYDLPNQFFTDVTQFERFSIAYNQKIGTLDAVRFRSHDEYLVDESWFTPTREADCDAGLTSFDNNTRVLCFSSGGIASVYDAQPSMTLARTFALPESLYNSTSIASNKETQMIAVLRPYHGKMTIARLADASNIEVVAEYYLPSGFNNARGVEWLGTTKLVFSHCGDDRTSPDAESVSIVEIA